MRFFRGKDDRTNEMHDEMNEEMRFHIDMEAEDLERMGMSKDEARRRALAAFGGVRRHVEEGTEVRRGRWSDDFLRDLRYSLRSLRRSPGYAFVVMLTLALGIAANTSIFSVANGILFKRLPYRDPARLMVLWDGLDWIGVSEAWIRGPEVELLRKELKQFEGISAIRNGSVTIGGARGEEPQQVPQASVSANFFQVLGAGPDIGRAFAKGEDAPGAPRVAVISRRLWTQRYGADGSIIGKPIIVDGKPVTVIGVLPANFQFTSQTSLTSANPSADVYTTLTDTLGRYPAGSHQLGVLARVKAAATVPSALSELGALSKRLDQEVYGKRGFKFVPVVLQERMVREVRPALLALLGAVAMLIAIMCANLAVLALVRTSRRDHELTVRRAIGASQSRVARQILTETVVLAIGGAIVGTLMGTWALRALLAIAPAGLPRRGEIGIDLVVLAVTLGVALVVGIGMGLAPVMHAARSDIATVLREKAPSRTGGRVRRTLVLAQLALSMMLLAGTGLLLGSFVKLLALDQGFHPDGVLTVQIQASRAKYTTGAPVVAFYERTLTALRALPGVTSVAATAAPPLSAGTNQIGFYAPSSPANTGIPEKDRLLIDVAPVTSDAFRTMGIAMLAGREFNSTEHDSVSYRVVILDDLLAKRYFPAGNAVGQTILIDGDSLRVIGVSRHVRMYNLEDQGREQAWFTHGYMPFRFMVLTIKTSGDPVALSADVRRAIHAVDPDQAIINIAPLTDSISAALAQRKLVLTLVGMFAAAALLLVALGIYGITASSVAQRTRELGIRMALGANRRRVVWNVLGEPTRLVALGLVLGLGGTFLVGRLVRGLLYDVRPGDPLTLIAVSLVLLGVGALASYVPAMRATRVDPMEALRSD